MPFPIMTIINMSSFRNRRRFLLLCLVLFFICRCSHTATEREISEEEVKAMQSVLNTLGLDGIKVKNTGDDQPCTLNALTSVTEDPKPGQNNSAECWCPFNGTRNDCHITKLTLQGFSFSGNLSAELSNLKYLKEIDLSHNCLTGEIPASWASMTNLTSIVLAGNMLSGNIPKGLGSLKNLEYLSLEANQFTGFIPAELGNLVNLETLILSSNLLAGTLPETFGQLKILKDFRLSDNQLNGTIPDLIGNWTNLQRLELYASGLEGPMPPAIFLLANLSDLRISDINKASFQLPRVPQTMKNLVLRNVSLYGRIPEDIWRLKLVTLDLTLNNIDGPLPGFVELPNFTFVGHNRLTGSIPDLFLRTSKYLDLSYNNFTWPSHCPEKININSYQSSSSKNDLSGILPCSNITSKCPKTYHWFHINSGGPDKCVNKKHGVICYEGDQDSGAAAMNYIGKSNWGFSSTGYYMDNVDSNYGNNFIASKPNSSMEDPQNELYYTARVSPLSLTYYGYCLQNGNYNVHLHFSDIQLSEDEDQYNEVGRRIFDIYIQERLEQKDFNIKEAANGRSFYVFNSTTMVSNGVLEIRLQWAGRGTTCIPNRRTYGPLISAISVCHSKLGSEGDDCAEPFKAPSKAPLVGAVVSAVCFVVLSMGAIYLKFFFLDECTRERDLRGLNLQSDFFTLRQLKAATRNFDPMNKLGEGGFGSVYRGELSDGTFVAVKQLSSKSRQGNREFVTEVGMISGLQHPNLVKLHGCCIEGSHMLLVYEYMENNSLAHVLFGTKSNLNALKLDWKTRLKICIGIAKGLAFLHEESPLKIVHRDIKATNILLDKDLNAKISDFGLAKLKDEDDTHISTRVAGTMGYMAPEYVLWGYLTDKADVYSFGVVALEIVSGRSNASFRPQEEYVCLLDWAFVLQQKRALLDVVDPELGYDFNEEEAISTIKVALLCTNASPSLRPTMSEVVSMLEGQCYIEEVNSDIGIYGEGLRFKPLKDQYQKHQYQRSSSNHCTTTTSNPTNVGSSSSTSVQDLYPVNDSANLDTREHSSLLR